jgi:hypothetical protein
MSSVVITIDGHAGDVTKEEIGSVAGQETHLKPIAFLNLTHGLASPTEQREFVTRRLIASCILLGRRYRALLVTKARFSHGGHTDEISLLFISILRLAFHGRNSSPVVTTISIAKVEDLA